MKTSTKLMIIAMLALAAGGTCPSDVNNDGTVGINDFLQVLGDWGPCPSARVVSVASRGDTGNAPFVLRLWSTGLVEVRRVDLPATGCWSCEESWPSAFTWNDFGTPAAPTADTKPVDLKFGYDNDLLVAYSDGTVYHSRFREDHLDPCNGVPTSHCELLTPDWEIVP